jgi:excisionase family DNA binding protein
MTKNEAKQSHPAADLLQLLSVDDASAILSVSSKTVRRMIDRGELPTCRLGRLVRVRRSDLERYIASCARV